MAKAQEEASMYAAKKNAHVTLGGMAGNPYGMLPGAAAAAGLLNPYNPMNIPGQDTLHMGMPPFDLSVYNPQLVSTISLYSFNFKYSLSRWPQLNTNNKWTMLIKIHK